MKLKFSLMTLIFTLFVAIEFMNDVTALKTHMTSLEDSTMTSLKRKPTNCSHFLKFKDCLHNRCEWCNRTCVKIECYKKENQYSIYALLVLFLILAFIIGIVCVMKYYSV